MRKTHFSKIRLFIQTNKLIVIEVTNVVLQTQIILVWVTELSLILHPHCKEGIGLDKGVKYTTPIPQHSYAHNVPKADPANLPSHHLSLRSGCSLRILLNTLIQAALLTGYSLHVKMKPVAILRSKDLYRHFQGLRFRILLRQLRQSERLLDHKA